jgi:hypothetical protein
VTAAWTKNRRLAAVALAVLVCLGAVLSRVFYDGHAAIEEGDAAQRRAEAARAAGDATRAHDEQALAITRWRRAARWYAPGAPHVARAYARLEGVARAADAAGDRDLALEAWRAVRSSALATRSFYTPYRQELETANARIAKLMAATEDPTLAPGQDEAARTAWHLALLARDEAPSVAWSIFAILGFFTWVGGGFWFAWRGVGAEDRLDRRQATVAGVLVAVGLLLWMVSLYKA